MDRARAAEDRNAPGAALDQEGRWRPEPNASRLPLVSKPPSPAKAMKTTFATVVLLAAASAVLGQVEPTPPPTPEATPLPTELPGDAAGVLPPPPVIVRPPGSPLGPSSQIPSVPLSPTPDALPVPSVSEELGWGSGRMELRQPAVGPLPTNGATAWKGVLPKTVRPERRGLGGFLAGLANLFNPFAPAKDGTAGSVSYWYDSRPNAAPMPRGMRDERFHEPQTELLSFDLDGGGEPAQSPSSSKAEPER